MTPISRELLVPCLAPFGESSTLPSQAYTDDAVFRWELEHFFDRSWVCVGRSEKLREPGDQIAVKIGLESALITRAEDGELHAFYNVCRHRGHELLEAGECASRKLIRCPYHAWAYGLDGELKGAPGFGKVEGFLKESHSLVPLRIEDWHGWLFVNASGDAPPFEDYAGSLGEIIENHRCGDLVSGARHDYEIAANWKLVAENYHECYHCPSIHPELCEVSPPTSSDNVHPDGPWIGGPLDLAEGVETMSLSGESLAPNLPGLTDEQERKTYYFQLFPNILISAHPDYVMTHILRPLAPNRTRIECEWLFSRETVDSEGFDPTYASEFWDITNEQDWRACEAVQRGVSSRGYRQGPLSPREDAVYDLISMVADGYLTGSVTRPANRKAASLP